MYNFSNTSKNIAIFLINLISKTWRIKIKGEMPALPSVVAFWHGSMLPVWKIFGKLGANGLVSQSKDGELLCKLINKWGIKTVRGSSSKGAKEALISIIKLAGENILLVTPDGPKGPIFKFKAGAAISAQRSGSPLYLAKVKIYWKKSFNRAWDKFQFPLPFTKIEISFDGPNFIPQKLGKEEVSEYLNECERKLS